MRYIIPLFLFVILAGFTCSKKSTDAVADSHSGATKKSYDKPQLVEQNPNEKHLKDVRQLTFGGENAEAYFSFDNQQLVLQRTNKEEGIECDQIYYAKIPKKANTKGLNFKRVSNGLGRTTCSYFLPGDEQVIFASTHDFDEACPPTPDRSVLKKYVWPIYNSFELYSADTDGKNLKRWTNNEHYDAEATVSPDGKKIVYTSNKTGDLEIYVMNIDGSNEVQITTDLGYDGGAFFSPDSKQIVWRASRPKTDMEKLEYKELMGQQLVAPTKMELFVANIDGTNQRQITNLGGANWAPFFHPSGEKLLFSSNYKTKSFPFNLYMINLDGTGLEQVTFDKAFDSFPMFSPDGTKLLFSSNRNNGGSRDTNVFIADWVD